MRVRCGARVWSWETTWMPGALMGLAVSLLAVVPAPLVPVARAYEALCARLPVLALLTRHVAPLPLALLLSLAGLALLTGTVAGTWRLVGTIRFNGALGHRAQPIPPRLVGLAERLDIDARITSLAQPIPAAFCYGFLRPRIAVTTGLLEWLDDEELLAVLAHERHHLRRRDPLRYLVLHALNAAACFCPLAPALRGRQEARIELAADRAALAVVPREALAGALMTALSGGRTVLVGAAGLSATEARIAHLAGTPALPAIPIGATVGSLLMVVVIAAAAVDLTTSAHLVRMVCRLCAGTS